MTDLTAEELKKLLRYDPETGEFKWLNGGRWNHLSGQKAGTTNTSGYLVIRIAGKLYYAHRLAWLYHYGEFPKELDHINGLKADNRISNLRLVDHSTNMHNVGLRINNTSKFIGVTQTWDGKWMARIRSFYRVIYLGRFKTKEEAAEAYLKKHRELNPELY